MSALPPSILALPAPGNPLARYVAIREAQLANPYLATTEHWGILKVFSGTVSADIIRYRNARIESNLKFNRRARSRVRRMAKRHQSKWPPLAGKLKSAEVIYWNMDRLPERGKAVLIATYNEEVGEGVYDGAEWKWITLDLVIGNVAGWADLPSGPIFGRGLSK